MPHLTTLKIRFKLLSLAALAIGFSCPGQSATQPRIDSILILKKAHLLELISNGKPIRIYKVALGRGGLAPKEKEGDSRNPNSHYYKALHISYPSAADRKRAASQGVSPGGAIMIHGLPNGLGFLGSTQHLYDWTLGCVAVSDAEMDEIWNLVPTGTPVEIRP